MDETAEIIFTAEFRGYESGCELTYPDNLSVTHIIDCNAN